MLPQPGGILIAFIVAHVAAQSAVLTFTNVPNPMTIGEAQAIYYAANRTFDPATIILNKGPADTLDTIGVITDSATSGRYVWTPPASLDSGDDYALEIRQAGENSFFGPFGIRRAERSSSVASSSSSIATSSSSSSWSSASSALITTTTSAESDVSPSRASGIDDASQARASRSGASDGLSSGAAAGVRVRATIGAMSFVLVVLWMIWRRRKRPKVAVWEEGEDAMDISPSSLKPEKDGTERFEAPDTSPWRFAEAEDTSRAELEGEWRAAGIQGKK